MAVLVFFLLDGWSTRHRQRNAALLLGMHLVSSGNGLHRPPGGLANNRSFIGILIL